jgi:hypothetical protein
MDSLTLNKREKELQTDVCELEWPDDATEQFSILKLIQDFREETETSQRRTAAIIGWPESTLRGRMNDFRRSDGVLVRSGAHGDGFKSKDTAIQKARRIAKANPEAFLDDVGTMKAVSRAFEAEPLPQHGGIGTSHQRQAMQDEAAKFRLSGEFFRWYMRGKSLLKLAEEAGKLNKAEREEMEDTAERARALIDLLVTVATSGDWDDELESLLTEGA